MTTKRALVAASQTASATLASLRDRGEAFVGGDGEAIDPNRVTILPSQCGKTEYLIKTQTEGSDLPNRISIERHSPYYTSVGAYIGVRLNGEEVEHCVEFNVIMGWVRVGIPDANGRVSPGAAQDAPERFGKVEAYWRMQPSRQVRRQLARIAR